MTHSSPQNGQELTSPRTTALDRIRVWHLLLGSLLVFLASGSVAAALRGTFAAFQSFTVLAITYVGSVVGWITWTAFRQGLSLTALFGRPPMSLRAWSLIGVVFFADQFMARADLNVIIPLLEKTAPALIADWYAASTVQPPEQVPNIVLSALTGILFAGVVEEILFRGLIFQRWARTWNRPVGALLVTSGLFAALHGGTLLSTFVFGVAATLLYIQTRSLWAPVAMHMATNGIIIMDLNPAEAVLVPLGIGGRQEFGWTCFVLSMVLITVLFWCCRRKLSDPLPYITNKDAI
ncbi:CPBP family intramembrane glutamic endopeptidase [Salinibacter altiplanensis]|uniref:CPBP family intramembrane glutamic endopeptidase n=1 Tax=Salinibacter altiplanensis TaxID=1803181 RepID=UPI0012FFFB25|nr:CPBP family intramembrane glutamic endopeptidase [Salinibacter altiplanensis]